MRNMLHPGRVDEGRATSLRTTTRTRLAADGEVYIVALYLYFSVLAILLLLFFRLLFRLFDLIIIMVFLIDNFFLYSND
jgi:hypothetical protein